MPQLTEKILITGEVFVESGLLIGGSSSALEIGGTDRQVVRNPISKRPYIPGSSLKGKMRSLFELNRGEIGADEKGNFGPTQNPKHAAARLFGHIKAKQNDNKSQQPSRLIVRDGELKNPEKLSGTELLYTEVKAENSIDRVTAVANPRFFERVPRGAIFQLSMVINVFDDDAESGEQYLAYVFDSLRLVQDDYLGGCGSRGNGQVLFNVTNVRRRPKEYYMGDKKQEAILNDQIPDDLQNAGTA